MMNKVLTLLGFASKAGKLSFGMDAAKKAVISGKSRLVVTAEDISAKSRKEIAFYCEKNTVPVLLLNGFDIETVSHAVGKRCGIISVDDSGFAGALLSAEF